MTIKWPSSSHPVTMFLQPVNSAQLKAWSGCVLWCSQWWWGTWWKVPEGHPSVPSSRMQPHAWEHRGCRCSACQLKVVWLRLDQSVQICQEQSKWLDLEVVVVRSRDLLSMYCSCLTVILVWSYSASAVTGEKGWNHLINWFPFHQLVGQMDFPAVMWSSFLKCLWNVSYGNHGNGLW